MQLRLKTKVTLTTALLVLVVVAFISSVYVGWLADGAIGSAAERAQFVTQQVFLQSQKAIEEAADAGAAPVSDSPEDLQAFVRMALEENAGLTSQIDSSLGYGKSVYEVSIVDRDQNVLISSDPALPGRPAFSRPPLEALSKASFVEKLRVLYGPPLVFEVNFPFNLSGRPFGEIRVGLSTALLRNEIAPRLQIAGLLALGAVVLGTVLAAFVSHRQLAPLSRISMQLDRIARGEFDAVAPSDLHKVGALSGDELGQVSTKITRIGEQLRGVQEIFGSLRENIEHVMAGMDDGLILFTPDGRAALVSPSVEKFLGVPRDALLGRRVSEILPAGHPLQRALGVEGDQLTPAESVEVTRAAGEPGAVSRMLVSVHAISEHVPLHGARTGALVTLRDMDSFERLGSHLETTERLSAMGRVTAGVAHEVKNPLNAMTTWLGVLKEKMPVSPDGERQQMAQQALTVLESEIHRLDRVVKTFLDFTRPVEPDFAEVALGAFLEETAAVARPQYQRAGVTLKLVGTEDPATVRADRQLLKQAVLNLLLNAVEAIAGWSARPLGHVGRVETQLTRHADRIEIRIADNGPGIPPDKREKVFQLFFTTRKGGSGIGLAMAYRIVQFHHGSIDFLSEAGHGATFRIQLPVLSAGSRRTGDSAARPAAGAEVAALRMDGARRA
jgi:signal transduction histidine kinase/HAMP domain-containing protein